jgi:hypothetical protein
MCEQLQGTKQGQVLLGKGKSGLDGGGEDPEYVGPWNILLVRLQIQLGVIESHRWGGSRRVT